MYELRLAEQRIVYEGENEPPRYELEILGTFPCESFEECLDKLVELYEPEMEATIIEAEGDKEILKIAGGKLVYLDQRFLETAVSRLPGEFLEPDEDEERICRSEDRSKLPAKIIAGRRFYDEGTFLFSEDCSMVIRINWP